jgi:hypothetical protein
MKYEPEKLLFIMFYVSAKIGLPLQTYGKWKLFLHTGCWVQYFYIGEVHSRMKKIIYQNYPWFVTLIKVSKSRMFKWAWHAIVW